MNNNFSAKKEQAIQESKSSDDLFGSPVVLYFEQTEEFYITKKTKIFVTFEMITSIGEVLTKKERISKEDKNWVYYWKSENNEKELKCVLYAVAKKRGHK